MANDLTTLNNATDSNSWRETMRNGYVRAFLCFALHETGVWDALRASTSGLTTAELAGTLDLDGKALEHALTYMNLADVVLEREGERWRLTERASWLFEPRTIHLLYNNVGAYACLLYELVPTLRKQKTYGKDFVRRGDYLAIGTRGVTVESHGGIMNEIKRLEIGTFGDLGCGSAHLLVKFCREAESIRGVGVDISEGALATARQTVAEAGMSDRIRLVQGDVGDPASFADKAQDVELFVCIAVLHEFLRDGEEGVLRVLGRMKECFPGRYLVLGEFNRLPPEQYADVPIDVRYRYLFYQELMHPLSNQGLMSQQDWLRTFEKAKVEVLGVQRRNLDIYLLKL